MPEVWPRTEEGDKVNSKQKCFIEAVHTILTGSGLFTEVDFEVFGQEPHQCISITLQPKNIEGERILDAIRQKKVE